MTAPAKPTAAPSPFRDLMLALATTVFIFAGIIWHVWNTYVDMQKTHEGFELQNLNRSIFQIDEVLTQSALSSMESDDLTPWADRYKSYSPELKVSIEEARALMADLYSPEFADQIGNTYTALLAQRRTAYDCFTAGDIERCKEVLSSRDHAMWQREFSEQSKSLAAKLATHTKASVVAHKQRAVLSVVFILLALPLLLYSWYSVLRAYRGKITHQAYYDSLTGLPNRLLLNDRLRQSLSLAKRNDSLIAILFLDLDRFKIINDTLGHPVGDMVLQAAANRLVGSLRDTDSVARMGGDEFIVILENLTNVQDTAKVAQKIMQELAYPFVIDGRELFITTSIGISIFPTDGTELEQLIKAAHGAMYLAKDQGRNCYQFYTQDMNARSFERLALENGLRRALNRDELELHYQPKVDTRTGRIVGMEALVRWRHPDMGLIYPASFIPLAEETGLIVDIGEWVLRKACQQNKKWMDEGFDPLRVAVNLSSRQFKMENFLQAIENVIKETGLSPEHLELELTEGVIMDNSKNCVSALQALSDMGVYISIDDFGTGYSSLSYLQRFKIDELKIDKSFVRDIRADREDAVIITAIIAMAHSLNLKVVAEGVETAEQLEFLKKYNCDYLQGYYFSQPVAPDAFCKLLEKNVLL